MIKYKSKWTIIVIILIALLAVSMLLTLFSPVPSSTMQRMIIGTYYGYLKYKSPEDASAPKDLAELGYFNNKLIACPPTTKFPRTKFLIVYNPNYRQNVNEDWIMIVGTKVYENFHKIDPLILWSSMKITDCPNATQLIESNHNLRYYYLKK